MKQLTPTEARARAARLRRIVRNGEELLNLLATMRQDVYREFIDQVHGTDRWEQRRDDFWDDLDKNYGNLQRIIPGRVESARRELISLGEPESFTRSKPEPKRTESREDYGRIMTEALEAVEDTEDLGAIICNL